MNIEDNPEMTEPEIRARAEHILHLESRGVPFDDAVTEGDQLIAIRRAFGIGPEQHQGE